MKTFLRRDHDIHYHCVTVGPEVLSPVIQRFPRARFGFTNLIYNDDARGRAAQATARALPLDRILTETDAPFHPPPSWTSDPESRCNPKRPGRLPSGDGGGSPKEDRRSEGPSLLRGGKAGVSKHLPAIPAVAGRLARRPCAQLCACALARQNPRGRGATARSAWPCPRIRGRSSPLALHPLPWQAGASPRDACLSGECSYYII